MPRNANRGGNRQPFYRRNDSDDEASGSDDEDGGSDDEQPQIFYEPDEISDYEQEAEFFGAGHNRHRDGSEPLSSLHRKRCFICLWLRDGDKRFHVVKERRKEFLNMLSFNPANGNIMYKCSEACNYFNTEIVGASNDMLRQLNEVRESKGQRHLEPCWKITPWIVYQHLMTHDASANFSMYYTYVQLGHWCSELHKHHSTKIISDTPGGGLNDRTNRRSRKRVDLNVMKTRLAIETQRTSIIKHLQGNK